VERIIQNRQLFVKHADGAAVNMIGLAQIMKVLVNQPGGGKIKGIA